MRGVLVIRLRCDLLDGVDTGDPMRLLENVAELLQTRPVFFDDFPSGCISELSSVSTAKSVDYTLAVVKKVKTLEFVILPLEVWGLVEVDTSLCGHAFLSLTDKGKAARYRGKCCSFH